MITHFLRVETLYWKILIINLVSGFLKVKIFETLVKADEVNVRRGPRRDLGYHNIKDSRQLVIKNYREDFSFISP